MQHLRWEKSGRTFTTENPNQFVYKSRIGQQNTPLDGGGFAPFLIDGYKLIHGLDSEFELAPDKQIIRKAGQILCSSFKFFVQANIGGEWVDQPHGVPTRNMRQGEVFRDRGWVENDEKCTGFLSFPDAYLSFGGNKPYDLNIGLEAGTEAKARIGFRFRAPRSGQVRFQAVLDGLQKLPTDWEWIWAQYEPEKGKEDRKIGVRLKDLEWRWGYDEAPFRDITVETNPDETKKVTILFGPYDYSANEWLFVYPDTWGPTQIADNNNDCNELNDNTIQLDGLDADGDMVGESATYYGDIGWRWPTVGVAPGVTIDDGCKVSCFQKYVGGGGVPDCIIKGVDEGDPDDWNTGTRPSQRDKVAATVNWTPSNNDETWQDTPELKTIIDDIINGGSFSEDDALAIVVEEDEDTANAVIQFQDYTRENDKAAKLTIVYTAAGGEDILKQATYYYQMLRNWN